ncbi:hypothetical protein BgiBS90_028932 [Biomphalaria glabrata]|nr:hypothetical protein BgiBS90_028932 [Biomphalaria glabrata]
MFYVAQNFGHHFQTLKVKCRHPYMLHCTCMKVAEPFNLLLAGFKSPDLSSFKVSGLRMECTSHIVMSQVGRTLTHIFTKDCHLKVFEMPDAEWREPEGPKLLDIVLQKSRSTLETLNIAE